MATIENQRVEFQYPHRDSFIASVASDIHINRRVPQDGLTLEALGLYLRINASFIPTPNTRKIRWTTRKIARHCGITWRRADRLVRELTANGYFEQRVVSRPNEDGLEEEKTVLIFLDTPQRLRDHPEGRVRVEGEIPVELILVDFAQFVIASGSPDSTLLAGFEFYGLLVEQFGAEKLCDFAQHTLLRGIPSARKLCDFTQLFQELCDSAQLFSGETVPSPPLPPLPSPPLDSLVSIPPMVPPSSKDSSPQNRNDFGTKNGEGGEGAARSARVLPAVEQVAAFAGKRPEGDELPVLVPTMDVSLLQQARMDDLMEQGPEAAAAPVTHHPTRDLIATYIEELGYAPPVMGRTLGAAKALTKLKEPCLPEELRQIYRFYKEQVYWKDKLLTLAYLAEHLIQWRMQGRPPAKAELRKAQQREAGPVTSGLNYKILGQVRADLVKRYGADSQDVKDHDLNVALHERDKHLYEEHGVTEDGEVY